MQRGRTLLEVKDALDHQTVAMTVRYAHRAPDHLRAAVAALDDVLPAQPPAESTHGRTHEPAEREVAASAYFGVVRLCLPLLA
jgi:hypothetical protein